MDRNPVLRVFLVALAVTSWLGCEDSSRSTGASGFLDAGDALEAPLQCGPDWNCLLVASTRCDSAEAHVLTEGGQMGTARSVSWSFELTPDANETCSVRVSRDLVTFSMGPKVREVAIACVQ